MYELQDDSVADSKECLDPSGRAAGQAETSRT